MKAHRKTLWDCDAGIGETCGICDKNPAYFLEWPFHVLSWNTLQVVGSLGLEIELQDSFEVLKLMFTMFCCVTHSPHQWGQSM